MHADPVRLLLGVGKSSTAWVRMPGWEDGFVIALLNNKHLKTFAPVRGFCVQNAAKNAASAGVRIDSQVCEALFSNGK